MDGKKSRREALPGTGSVLRRTSYFLAGHCHHFDDEEDEDDDDDDNGEDLLTTRSFLCRTSYVPFGRCNANHHNDFCNHHFDHY